MNHGTALRVYNLAKSFVKLGESVTVLTDMYDLNSKNFYEKNNIKYQVLEEKKEKKFNIYNKKLNFADFLKNYSNRYDSIILFSSEMLQYSFYCKETNVLCDIIDDPILASYRRIVVNKNFIKILKEIKFILEYFAYEFTYKKNVDFFLFVTLEDSKRLTFFELKNKVKVVKNGVAIKRIESKKIIKKDYILFVGNYDFFPNITAVEFLLKKIAPLVWKERPEIKFRFIGKNSPYWLENFPDERVECLGFVDDLTDFMSEARGIVIPMITGTGLKNKLLEAWAAGKAVVATPLACQGIPAVNGKNILISRTPKSFARSILKIWNDKFFAEKIGNSAYRELNLNFNWERIAKGLIEDIKKTKEQTT